VLGSRLPTFLGLRAFECAARHLSFTKAAEELHFSQATISYHIRKLEQEIGVRLFKRSARKIHLTPQGIDLQIVVNDSFGRLREGLSSINAPGGNEKITMSLTAPIGAKWLSTRLVEFARKEPSCEVDLRFSLELVDFSKDDCDLAIRWSNRKKWQGLVTKEMFSAPLIAVCSPELAESVGALDAFFENNHVKIMHNDDRSSWVAWYDKLGLDSSYAKNGPIIGDSLVLIDSAIIGECVILCRLPLILDELANKSLVRLSDVILEPDYCYQIVYPAGAGSNEMLQRMIDFILKESIKTRKQISGILKN
jgi:LysR family glycine cleavage system transcriptional activator